MHFKVISANQDAIRQGFGLVDQVRKYLSKDGFVMIQRKNWKKKAYINTDTLEITDWSYRIGQTFAHLEIYRYKGREIYVS